jgi:hypothetical protein
MKKPFWKITPLLVVKAYPIPVEFAVDETETLPTIAVVFELLTFPEITRVSLLAKVFCG